MINHQVMGFPTPTTNMVFVKGEVEFDNYPVKPGYTLWAKDLDAPVLYIKTVDLAGMTNKRIIDCKERKPNDCPSQYVTKADFENFTNQIFSLLQPKEIEKPKATKAKGGESDG